MGLYYTEVNLGNYSVCMTTPSAETGGGTVYVVAQGTETIILDGNERITGHGRHRPGIWRVAISLFSVL